MSSNGTCIIIEHKNGIIITMVLIINPRRACAARVTVVGCVCLSVCVCVCVSVTQHLTSRAIVHPKNDTTYFTGDEGQKICTVFSEKKLWRETRAKKANMLINTGLPRLPRYAY